MIMEGLSGIFVRSKKGYCLKNENNAYYINLSTSCNKPNSQMSFSQPEVSQAYIEENANGFIIVVPIKSAGASLGFVSYLFFIVFAAALLGYMIVEMEELNWLMIMWPLIIGGAILNSRILLWQAIGEEIITVQGRDLNIRKRGLLFFIPRTYDLTKTRNVRTQEDDTIYGGPCMVKSWL